MVSSLAPPVSLALVSWCNLCSYLFGECGTCLFPLMGGRCLLIRSIFKLGHVKNSPFFIAWMRVCLTGLSSVVLYQCASSVLVLSVMNLVADLCVGVGIGCGVVDRLTCHVPDDPCGLLLGLIIIISLL